MHVGSADRLAQHNQHITEQKLQNNREAREAGAKEGKAREREKKEGKGLTRKSTASKTPRQEEKQAHCAIRHVTETWSKGEEGVCKEQAQGPRLYRERDKNYFLVSIEKYRGAQGKLGALSARHSAEPLVTRDWCRCWIAAKTFSLARTPREYVRLRPSALGEGIGVAAQSVVTYRVSQDPARKSASKSSS
eukprot:1154001-Pelagomonas_calceolata.AAC.2